MNVVLGSNLRMWIAVAAVVIIGVLVTQGFLDGEFADMALGLVTGGAVGGAATAQAKERNVRNGVSAQVD